MTCFTNLDCEDFLLSEALTKALFEWVGDFGAWIDWETDGVVAGGVELEAAHNALGAELTELVKQELHNLRSTFHHRRMRLEIRRYSLEQTSYLYIQTSGR